MKRGAWAARILSAVAGSCLLASCVHLPRPKATRTSPQKTVAHRKSRTPAPVTIVETIVVRCPNEAEIRKLRAAKPKPLRNQKMPATAAERVAKTAAQLGLYEAKGQWADQVDDAFGRCNGE